jgi:3'(2'),5'-bisphosphate nucleotidase
MTDISDTNRLAEAFADLAARAGAAIMAIYATDFGARPKSDASPVTDADHAAEAIITEGLGRLLPGVPLVAEEAVAAGHAPDVSGGTFLLVDPLDGTREFVAKNGEFTVNIALLERFRPICGVVYAPALDVVYLGGRGARRAALAPGGRFARDDAAPITTRNVPADGLVALASRSHRSPETEAWLAERGIAGRVDAGSALKFGRLAEGAADVYPRLAPTMEWDTAAGEAVLRAAGGVVLGLDGRDMPYGRVAEGFRNGSFVAWGRAPGG